MKVAERQGWRHVRNRGDHMVYEKPDVPNNLSIPNKRELGPGMVKALIRTMGMSVDEFLAAIGRR